MLKDLNTRINASATGWQGPVQGPCVAVPGALALTDLKGATAGKALANVALSTGTYYFFIPTSGSSAVDVTLRTSAATGTGLSSAVTLYTVLSDCITAKGSPQTAAAFVNGTAQTLSITTLRGERGCLLKIVVPVTSTVTFDIADASAL